MSNTKVTDEQQRRTVIDLLTQALESYGDIDESETANLRLRLFDTKTKNPVVISFRVKREVLTSAEAFPRLQLAPLEASQLVKKCVAKVYGVEVQD